MSSLSYVTADLAYRLNPPSIATQGELKRDLSHLSLWHIKFRLSDMSSLLYAAADHAVENNPPSIATGRDLKRGISRETR